MTCSTVAGACRTKTLPVHSFSLPVLDSASNGPPTPLVNKSWHSALTNLAVACNLSNAVSHSALVRCRLPPPPSSNPSSKTNSPCSATMRSRSTSASRDSEALSSGAHRSRSRSRRRGAVVSERLRASRKSSSSAWCSVSSVSAMLGSVVEPDVVVTVEAVTDDG
ncbi:hypothetical protein ACKVWC_011557 [Pyricularia oryzae]